MEMTSIENTGVSDTELLITATQIQIRSVSGFFIFMRLMGSIKLQLANADGLVFVRFRGTKTLTCWQDKESMLKFRNKGAHLDAMRSLKLIGRAKSVTWTTNKAPDWSTASKKLGDIKF
ncbi:MAG: hypothetical protein AB8B79_19025 [Granulosicoccus sp.]